MKIESFFKNLHAEKIFIKFTEISIVKSTKLKFCRIWQILLDAK